MATLKQIGDGTGRELFPIQEEALTWLDRQTTRIVAIQSPTGTGKSLIVRTLQRAFNAAVVTPSNLLVDQYSATYPDVNVLKGKDHYDSLLTYKTCRSAALEGAPTFYNPISLFHLAYDESFQRPSVVVVDEAHQLLSTLMLATGDSFPATKWRLPNSTHAHDVVEWVKRQRSSVEEVSAKLERIALCLVHDPNNYVITMGNVRQRNGDMVRTLRVLPILPPKPVIDQVLGHGCIFLLSATLSRPDTELLAQGADYAYLDLPSPIPARQRPILYRPREYSSALEVIQHVEQLREEFESPVLVHVTYEFNKGLKSLPDGHLKNTAENKDEILRKFKEQGGVFWAAGCAEGIDLPDDQCRLNVIPVLPRPNIGDPAVMKWRARPGGDRRYDLETLKTFQQQVGRSTRHVNDWSITVCCDPRLPQTVARNRPNISDSFYDSIRWTGKPWPKAS